MRESPRSSDDLRYLYLSKVLRLFPGCYHLNGRPLISLGLDVGSGWVRTQS